MGGTPTHCPAGSLAGDDTGQDRTRQAVGGQRRSYESCEPRGQFTIGFGYAMVKKYVKTHGKSKFTGTAIY